MAVETFRVDGLKGVIDTLLQLPPEIVSKRGGPIRTSARKALEVIRKQEISNLNAIIASSKDVDVKQSTGLLAQNIVISRSKFSSGANGERFLLRVRKKTYTNKTGKPVVTSQNARLLEYGTEKRDALMFIRPAFDAKKGEAVSTFVSDVTGRIQKIVKKLERKNRVKV